MVLVWHPPAQNNENNWILFYKSWILYYLKVRSHLSHQNGPQTVHGLFDRPSFIHVICQSTTHNNNVYISYAYITGPKGDKLVSFMCMIRVIFPCLWTPRPWRTGREWKFKKKWESDTRNSRNYDVYWKTFGVKDKLVDTGSCAHIY